MNADNLARTLTNKVELNGADYYTVRTFAALTRRSEQAVRALINKGNRLGTLASLKLGNTIFVPCSELTEFKFATVGCSDVVIRFDENGNEFTERIAH